MTNTKHTDTSRSGDLKPCPFCGGEADEHRDRGPTGELYVWVGCNDCDATSACVDERSMQPEESDAQSLWNTRAEASIAEPVAWIFNHRTDNEVFMSLNKARMDPRYWTETPLYSHPPAADLAGYERGQRETVARIVAWLREQDGYGEWYDVADAIEAGEWK